MSKGEVGKIYIMEVEEVGIGISISEERIVEMEGTSTREDGIFWRTCCCFLRKIFLEQER